MNALLFVAAAFAATTPADQDSIMLARQVASHGMLATIAPMQTVQEIEQLVADHPEFSSEQAEQLRTIGRRRAEALINQAIEAEAAALAANLSLDDLRALANFAVSPASRHQREFMPQIIMATMQSLGTVDYRGGVVEEFCAETTQLCED